MSFIKSLHIACALLSVTGFLIRGIWMITDQPVLTSRWVRITPHLVDTILLASALILVAHLHLSPLSQPWLAAKIIALLVYIGLGMVALRYGKTKRVRIFAWCAALLSAVYILGVAVSKSPVFFIPGALLQ